MPQAHLWNVPMRKRQYGEGNLAGKLDTENPVTVMTMQTQHTYLYSLSSPPLHPPSCVFVSGFKTNDKSMQNISSAVLLTDFVVFTANVQSVKLIMIKSNTSNIFNVKYLVFSHQLLTATYTCFMSN